MKKTKNTHQCKVFYQDLQGRRQVKYDFLLQNSIDSVNWLELKPDNDNFFFTIKNFDLIDEYKKGIKLESIISSYSSGIQTKRDTLFIDNNKDVLLNRIKKLLEYSYDNDFIKKFNITDSSSYNLIKRIQAAKFDNNQIALYHYKPFVFFSLYYDSSLLGRSFNRIMKNFKSDNNVGLVLMKKIIPGTSFNQVLVTSQMVDINLYGFQTYVFPLFIVDNKENDSSNGDYIYYDNSKTDNFTKEFRQFIKAKYKGTYTPEEISGYIYAVLHSPTYRTKYLEFLKIDFPRIPFTDDEAVFQELSGIGWGLIEHHLLKQTYRENICRIHGTGDNFKVEKVEYENGKLWFNKERFFEPVPEPIWNFHIGGYRVLDKWLKERKKHEITLSSEDVQHFVKVVNVLDYTIKTMQTIEEKTKWV